MSPDQSRAGDQDPSPFCPQCGSDDTAPIQHEPQAKGGPAPGAKGKEPSWFRCLTCRYKWKDDD